MRLVRKAAVLAAVVVLLVLVKAQPAKADGPCGQDCWSIISAAEAFGAYCSGMYLFSLPPGENIGDCPYAMDFYQIQCSGDHYVYQGYCSITY